MAGMSGTRITITIPKKQYETLELVASSMSKRPGDVAKDMVLETLGFLQDVISNVSNGETNEQVLRTMYKMTFLKLAEINNE